MIQELSWAVGGQQGEGIESTGEILAATLSRLGYHIYGYRTFSSRIKGGQTNYRIRISTRRVLANQDYIDVLVAFDQETIRLLANRLRPGSLVIADSTDFRAEVPADRCVRLVEIPLTSVAESLGNAVMKNMVAMGATAAVIGFKPETFADALRRRFGSKGETVVTQNLTAVQKGFDAVVAQLANDDNFHLAPADGRKRYLMSGDEAAAFGALAAGCRIEAAYPITPASEVMHWLAEMLPKYGGVVVQTEDEIAALMTAVGAGYAGVRAMTSTSGPGFSLMMEALGYAGATETPVVIVDVQRAGPSTGMPTKTEQSDLNEMVYGSHGDLARIVLTPGTVEECFYDTARAFDLAEHYQVPVIVAMDLANGLGVQTVEGLDYSCLKYDRGERVSNEELAALDGAQFLRYRFTPSGISPRAIPGQPGGMFLATGNEHDQTGHIVERADNRVQIMNKRIHKLDPLVNDDLAFVLHGPADAGVVLVAFGSTIGPVLEARERLEHAGTTAAVLQVRMASPFAAEKFKRLTSNAGKIVVIENNASGQLYGIIRREVPELAGRLASVRKYDGTPFTAGEVVAKCQEVL